MDSCPEQYDEMAELLTAMSDTGLSAPQARRLGELMRGDPDVQQLYLDFVELHTMLVWQHREGKEERGTRNEERQDGNDECERLNDEQPESTSGEWRVESGESAIQCPPFGLQQPLPSPVNTIHYPLSTIHLYVGGALFSYLLAAMIVGVGLLIAWAWKLPDASQVAHQAVPSPSRLAPGSSSKMQFVGRITGMVDCQWEGWRKDEGGRVKDELPTAGNGLHPSSFIPHPSSPVSLGDKFTLSSGLLEITYDTGAKVILQGPVTYEVESSAGGFLSVGKLTARVDKKEERRTKNEERSGSNSSFLIPHSYFAVRTPTAIVTDLGTEFGVEVDKQGVTTSHVFRGSVSLQVAGDDKQISVAPLVLRENESARVEKSGDKRVIVPGPSAEPTEFVRKLVMPTIKTLDLVDVVAGGDGFSGRRQAGIDPRNGQPANIWPSASEQRFRGDGNYYRVQGMPFVDGVFIPRGKSASDRSVQLDSAGHSFTWFPNTDGRTLGPIWAGGKGGAISNAKLGGVDYDSPGHAVLDMHANKGITFDLAAIRQANPDWKIVRFSAVAGNTAQGPRKGNSVLADLWVFVDGQPRFQRRQINQNSGPMPTIIPLSDEDCFLTLVATDGGDGIGWDHTMFGDPRLELVSTQKTAGPTPPPEAAGH